jgi:hypothetical protein
VDEAWCDYVVPEECHNVDLWWRGETLGSRWIYNVRALKRTRASKLAVTGLRWRRGLVAWAPYGPHWGIRGYGMWSVCVRKVNFKYYSLNTTASHTATPLRISQILLHSAPQNYKSQNFINGEFLSQWTSRHQAVVPVGTYFQAQCTELEDDSAIKQMQIPITSPPPILSLHDGRLPHVHINQRLQRQFRAPDDERYAARNMLSLQ